MTLVYRYYDQAELERQLNARATVPGTSWSSPIFVFIHGGYWRLLDKAR